MDWAGYRRYRHMVVWPLVGLAGILMVSWPEHPAAWIGAACVGLLGISYLIEEIAWRLEGLGRPCPHCGQRAQLRSFRIRSVCSNYGQTL
jgi:hypothetical protein